MSTPYDYYDYDFFIIWLLFFLGPLLAEIAGFWSPDCGQMRYFHEIFRSRSGLVSVAAALFQSNSC